MMVCPKNSNQMAIVVISTSNNFKNFHFFDGIVDFFFSVSLLSFANGLLYAWPSAAIPILTTKGHPLYVTLEECSYFVILAAAVQVVAAPFYALLMKHTGHKWAMFLIAISYHIACLTVGISNSKELLYVSRLFAGLGDGGIYTVYPAYIGEISTPSIRGLWGAIPSIVSQFGSFTINLVGTFLPIKTTGYMMSVVPLIFIGFIWFLPQTPYYALMQSNLDGAMASLRKLHMKDDIDVEFEQLQKDVQRQTSEPGTMKYMITIKSNRKAILIAMFTRVAQQFAGMSAFIIYCQYLFQQAGRDVSYVTSSSIFIGMMIIFSSSAIFILDKFGRRLALITSLASTGIVLLSEVIFFALKDYLHVDVSLVSWYPLAGLILYTITYSFGLSSVPPLLLTELFSISVKGKCLMINTMALGVGISTSTKLFQTLTSNYGLVGSMSLFTICCFLSTFIAYFYLPETKGKTLEEIQTRLKEDERGLGLRKSQVRVKPEGV